MRTGTHIEEEDEQASGKIAPTGGGRRRGGGKGSEHPSNPCQADQKKGELGRDLRHGHGCNQRGGGGGLLVERCVGRIIAGCDSNFDHPRDRFSWGKKIGLLLLR